MFDYLNKILKEGEDKEYTQEQHEKSLRDVRKIKLILKHVRPNKSVCSFYIVAFPTFNEVKIFPIFTALYTPHSEFSRIKKKIESVLPNNIKVWEWMGGGVDCDEWKELAKNVTPETKSSFSEFIFPEHKDEELTEKWSEKYKRSIDCNNPKGFSQKAHCQGRKKKDLDEYGRTLKMARRQGVGTRFPKSAIKANPGRFRKYTRDMNEESLRYLDRVVELCRILNEEKKPDAEWEFEVKKNVDKSLDWVKTKDQAISYIKTLFDKIKNVSDNIKYKILKYVIYSFVGILSITQMNNIYDGLTKEKPNLEQLKVSGGGEEKKIETQKKPEITTKKRVRDYDEKLTQHIKNEEGSIENRGEPVLTAYDIGDGAKTIGYGHAIFRDKSMGNTGGDYPFIPKYNKVIVGKTKITKKQAEEVLRDDLDKTKEQLNKILDEWEKDGITPDIDQDMYNAMISMMYNMGIGNFKKSQFIKYVKQNELDKAKEQIKKESSRSFRRFPGVKKRREKESKMFGGEPLNESEEKSSSLKSTMLKIIDNEGLIRATQRVNGIERLGKILNETPEMLLTKYLTKKTFSTNDIQRGTGGYNFKFELLSVKNYGYVHEFVYSIKEGTVELIMTDDDTEYNLFGNYVRELESWWEIQFEIRDVLRDFSEELCEKIKLDVEDFTINYSFRGKKESTILEETEDANKNRILEKQVKKLINRFTRDIEFPENFYDFMVDVVEDKRYDKNILKITTVMKKPFSDEDSINLDIIKRKFMNNIRPMFQNNFGRFSTGSTATLQAYKESKEGGYL